MLWIKAFHIIFVITWFAGIFYLPRLFVYHAECRDDISNERFKIMERKLYYGISTPGAILTLLFGIWSLSYMPQYYLHVAWMHSKLLLVVMLLGYHILCGVYLKRFKEDRNTKSHVFYRWFNEVPVLLLFAIVILVIVQP